LELVDRGHAEHLELTQPIDRYPWIHAWLRCEALAHAGRLHEAETLALAEHEQGVADASAEAQAYFAWHLATVVGDRGHVRSAARRGDLAGEAAALHCRARIDHPAEVLDRLEALAVTIEGELAVGRAAHVRALAAGDADELAEVSAAFERMGADLLAAEAAAQ